MWADRLSFSVWDLVGAGNGIRTRDIQLGRLTLYQLSYSRGSPWCPEVGGGRRIRTFAGVSRQIYSLLPLAARASLLNVLVPVLHPKTTAPPAGAGGGSRTRDLPLTRRVLCRLSYASLTARFSCAVQAKRDTCPAQGDAL